MENIYSKDKSLVAIKVSSLSEGTNAVTDNSCGLQLLTIKKPKGSKIEAHGHTPTHRITEKLQECLFVKSGKIKVGLYENNGTFIKDDVLLPGEALILLNGGWSVDFLEESELFETKNGPYKEDKISHKSNK